MDTSTKKKRFYKNVQLITTNFDGLITYSDKTIFTNWKENVSIFDAHPFFEIIKTFYDDEALVNQEQVFPCVHLTSKTIHKICDVTIVVEAKEIAITIFDYTRAYQDLNKISQERNESLIKAQELSFTNKLLMEKEAFKNEFIANINHEIATPIASINGFLELLEKTELDYKQEELIKIIKKEGQYLTRLFTDMLDLSKIELGNFKLIEEPFDIVELFNSIESSYKHIIEEKALDFIVEIDPKIKEEVVGDKTRLYQIVNNLLNNAIKYTEEGQIAFRIKKIEGKRRKQKIEISIEDTGIGIAQENLNQIFNAFTQINEGKEGSGLGLHVVNKLVSLMRGTIAVDSTINEGTKFTITINFKNNDKENLKEVKENVFKLKEGKKYRALIVENKLSIQYLIMKILLDEGAFFVDVVPSAEEAIKAIENRNYNIVITDIKLSKMSGLELAKKIREDYSDSFIKEIPILAISALNTPNIKNLCVANGIDSFLQKPFSQEAFIQKIAKLIIKKERA